VEHTVELTGGYADCRPAGDEGEEHVAAALAVPEVVALALRQRPYPEGAGVQYVVAATTVSTGGQPRRADAPAQEGGGSEPVGQRAVVGHPAPRPRPDRVRVGFGLERTGTYDRPGGPAVDRARLHRGVHSAMATAVQKLPQAVGGDHDPVGATAGRAAQSVHHLPSRSIAGPADGKGERAATGAACGMSHTRVSSVMFKQAPPLCHGWPTSVPLTCELGRV
jgi:hypothetical protein